MTATEHATRTLPTYDELPVREGAPAGSSWGVWGDDDVFGCLNLLTPERVVRAAALVTRGALFPLNFDLELPDPPLFNRAGPEHTVTGGARGHDDILNFNTQCSSQWDGFRHVASHHGFYNGIADEQHGIHHWAQRGLAGRGVLADVGRWREQQGRPLRLDAPDPIEPTDVDATLEAQGVAVEEGDILLIRTGWIGWYRTLDGDQRAKCASQLRAPGLRPGMETARWAWNLHIAALAADNPSVEVWPPGTFVSAEQRQAMRENPDLGIESFVHRALLPLLGLPLGELWDLDRLADDCSEDGRYTFFVTSAPLNVHAGVASPPNVLALK